MSIRSISHAEMGTRDPEVPTAKRLHPYLAYIGRSFMRNDLIRRIPKKGGKEDGRPWKHFTGKQADSAPIAGNSGNAELLRCKHDPAV